METPRLSGFAIQKWRQRRKMTQQQLSDKSKIAFRTLQRWEAGDIPKNPKLKDVEALAAALRCEPMALFVPGWQRLYEGLLLEFQEVLLLSDTAVEKSVEVARVSRELRQFFPCQIG